jgi:Bacteriophage related domain of unknown function
MASDVVSGAVEDYLLANWTATPLSLENDEFKEPDPPAPWVMMEITGTLYAQESIGAFPQSANRWDEEGLIWLHVFVPSGTGGRDCRRFAKQLADLFRGTTLLSGALEFRDSRIGEGRVANDNGNFFCISVSIDWRRMEA